MQTQLYKRNDTPCQGTQGANTTTTSTHLEERHLVVGSVLRRLTPLSRGVTTLHNSPTSRGVASVAGRTTRLTRLSTRRSTLLSNYKTLATRSEIFLTHRPRHPRVSRVISTLFASFFRRYNSHRYGRSTTVLNNITLFRNRPIAIVNRHGNDALRRGLHYGFNVPKPRNCHGTLHLVGRTRGFSHPVVAFVSAPNTCPNGSTRRHKRNRTVTHGLVRVDNLAIPIVTIIANRNSSNNTLTLNITGHVLVLRGTICSILDPRNFTDVL